MLLRSALVFLASFTSFVRAEFKVVSDCVNPNHVALTFDDGPYKNSQWARQTLNEAGIKGTFFYNGVNWDCIYYHVEDIRDIFADGHEVLQHTWNHWNLTELSADSINNQMYLMERALKRILGVQVGLMRPPFGSINDTVVDIIFQRNQSVILWNVDSGDADGVNPYDSQKIYDQAIQANKNGTLGGILTLNHETHDTTLSIVIPYAIKALKDAGFEFVTVSECVNLPAYQGPPVDPEPFNNDWLSECVWPQ